MLGRLDAQGNHYIESSILDINASRIANEPDYLTITEKQKENWSNIEGSFKYIAETEGINLTMLVLTSATASTAQLEIVSKDEGIAKIPEPASPLALIVVGLVLIRSKKTYRLGTSSKSLGGVAESY